MTFQDLAREEYAKDPSLSPFSRRPISFDLAVELGTNRAAKAYHRANARLAERIPA